MLPTFGGWSYRHPPAPHCSQLLQLFDRTDFDSSGHKMPEMSPQMQTRDPLGLVHRIGFDDEKRSERLVRRRIRPFADIDRSVSIRAQRPERIRHRKRADQANLPACFESGVMRFTTAILSGPGFNRKLEQVLADLYPTGPMEQDIWLRAGGDVSRLKLSGNGSPQWFSAIRVLSQGGGGADITRETLINAALQEFPNHKELKELC